MKKEQKFKIVLLIILIIFIIFIIYFFIPKTIKTCSDLPPGHNLCIIYKCNQGIPYFKTMFPQGGFKCLGGKIIDEYKYNID